MTIECDIPFFGLIYIGIDSLRIRLSHEDIVAHVNDRLWTRPIPPRGALESRGLSKDRQRASFLGAI